MSLTKRAAAKNIKPELIAPKQSLPQWRNDLMEWLESNNQEPFVREGLALAPEEIMSLREEFLPNAGLLVSIKSHSISLVKV